MDKRTRLYAQLLAASKERREANVVEHKLRTNRIRRSLRARRKLQETNKEAKIAKVPLDFLAIGDSWFEYPLYDEVLSFQNNGAGDARARGSSGYDGPTKTIASRGTALPAMRWFSAHVMSVAGT